MTAAKDGWDVNPDTSFQVNWTTNWGTDDESWHARGFAHSEDAEAWARKLTKENEGNEKFWLLAQRLVVVSTADFLEGKRALDLTVCDRVTLPNGYLGEGR